jgi:hypothetical protein
MSNPERGAFQDASFLIAEYLGWCLNKAEFLAEASKLGLTLVREFVIGEQPPIANAPEPCQYRGFLFRAAFQ